MANEVGCKHHGQCTSDFCPDGDTHTSVLPESERFICRDKLTTGTVCGIDASSEKDLYCANNKCGQYSDNDFRCCTSMSELGTGQDWCTGMADGVGCKHHGYEKCCQKLLGLNCADPGRGTPPAACLIGPHEGSTSKCCRLCQHNAFNALSYHHSAL